MSKEMKVYVIYEETDALDSRTKTISTEEKSVKVEKDEEYARMYIVERINDLSRHFAINNPFRFDRKLSDDGTCVEYKAIEPYNEIDYYVRWKWYYKIGELKV